MQASFAIRSGVPGRPCEDWAGAGPTVAVVLDGLSTPAGHKTGCRHGTPWYVDQLGPALLAAASSQTRPLPDALATAIEQVADRHRGCDLHSTATPSATVAAVRLPRDSDQLEYLVLADTTVFLNRADGSRPETISDHRVDDVARDQIEAALKTVIGTPEHRDALRDLVTRQRELRNTPEGYWIAGSDPSAAHHAVTGSRPTAAYTEAALLTDGASCIVTTYGQLADDQVIAYLRTHGPDALINLVRRAEADDPDGERWPRFKSSDDATALHLHW